MEALAAYGDSDSDSDDEERELARLRVLRAKGIEDGGDDDDDDDGGEGEAGGGKHGKEYGTGERPAKEEENPENKRERPRVMARKFEIDFSSTAPNVEAGHEAAHNLRDLVPASFVDSSTAVDRSAGAGTSGRHATGGSEVAHGGQRVGDDDEEEEDDGDGDGGDEDEFDEWGHLPIHSECRLAGAKRAVACVDVEHSGNRVAAGSHDGSVLLYDFNGMKSDLQPFRSLNPCGTGHQIRCVSWSPSGELLLVVPSSSCAAVLSRDGGLRGEFIKGDMYIRDMKNTKGHVAGLTGGQWSRTSKSKLATCGEDGTVRIWDASRFGSQLSVLKAARGGGGGASSTKLPSVACCCWAGDDKLIAGGMRDGSVQIWDASTSRSAAIGVVNAPRQQMVKKQDWSFAPSPKTNIRRAFGSSAADDDVTVCGIAWYPGSNIIAARSMSGAVKVWDIRKNGQTPLAVNESLPLSNGSFSNDAASLCFSPDGTLLLTPTLVTTEGAAARQSRPRVALAFLDRSSLQVVREYDYGDGHSQSGSTADYSLSSCCWNGSINQIFVGGGLTARTDDGVGGTKMRYEGFTSVFYSREFSARGALLSVPRSAKTRDITDAALLANMRNNLTKSVRVREHPVPRRRKDGSSADADSDGSKKRKLEPSNILQSHSGRGVQGRTGATSTTLLRQHMFAASGQKAATAPANRDLAEMHKDPRELLLRYADKPNVFTAAYDETQPVPILSKEEDHSEDSGGGR